MDFFDMMVCLKWTVLLRKGLSKLKRSDELNYVTCKWSRQQLRKVLFDLRDKSY